ncbi:MAG: acyltransferase family protein [Sphingomonas sp.]|uniref:acyltransferase family protein n=1 Tax=Sphingomonas sp. TaxID=28214 RepID=UPI003F7DE4DD
MESQERTPLLPGLQYYRAIAAVLVVFYHAALSFGPGGYYPVRSWERIFLFGHVGVELFFVLSGFIICQIHWDRLDRPGEFPSYIRKRLVRIYPPVFLAVLTWAAFRGAGHKPLSPMEWLNSLTLFPFTFDFAPPVVWTLAFEIAFYSLFLVAFVSRRAFLLSLAVWGLSGYLLCEFTDVAHRDQMNALFGSAYVFLFGLGALTFLIGRRVGHIGANRALALSIIGLAVFAIAAGADVQLQLSRQPNVALEIAQRSLTPLFGLAGSFWILAMASTGFALRGMAHKILFFLGNASFAIYLWHLLAQRLLAYGLGRAGLAGVGARPIAILLLAAAGIALGSLVYTLVERPMLRRLNAWFAARGV